MNYRLRFIKRFSVLAVLILGLFYFGLSDNNSSAATVPCCQDCPTYQGCNDSCGSNQNCLTFCYNAVDRCERSCVVC